jgi:protein MpaA
MAIDSGVNVTKSTRPGDVDPPDALIAAVEAFGLPGIGMSTLGRSIRAARFPRAAADAPWLLVVGGVHGNEPSSVAAALDLIADLRAHPSGAASICVVPVLNPDAVVLGTKDSARNVDLNRNFPARNFSIEYPPGYFPGPHALSEPESAALVRLVDDVAPVGVVALHAPFACINYDGPAAAWAEAVARASGWPARADIGYPTPGSLGSWLGADRGLPVLTIELPPGPYAAFRGQARAALQSAINPERMR